MKNKSATFFLLAILFGLGCDRRNPTPELMDPIFIDMTKEREVIGGLIHQNSERLKSIDQEIKKTPPRTIELSSLRKEKRDLQAKLAHQEQLLRFLEIRIERRRISSRRAYHEARNQGTPWPHPEEFSDYLMTKNFKNAPREWSRSLKERQGKDDSQRNPAASAH